MAKLFLAITLLTVLAVVMAKDLKRMNCGRRPATGPGFNRDNFRKDAGCGGQKTKMFSDTGSDKWCCGCAKGKDKDVTGGWYNKDFCKKQWQATSTTGAPTTASTASTAAGGAGGSTTAAGDSSTTSSSTTTTASTTSSSSTTANSSSNDSSNSTARRMLIELYQLPISE